MARPLALLSVLVTLGAVAAAPPDTAIRPVTDTLHGDKINDDYRWLEGDNSDPANMGQLTPEVTAWTDRQNAYTRTVLDRLPGRTALEARLRELMEVPSISLPAMHGERYFHGRREGGQPQAVRYVRTGIRGQDRVLLDPQQIDPSGLTTVAWTAPSRDGSLMAFGLYRSGDENTTLYLMDVATGTWLAEEIPGKVSFSGWLEDNSGFFYTRLEDIGNAYSRVMKYHRLGTHHRQDKVLFRQQDIDFFYAGSGKSKQELETIKSGWGPNALPSKDGRWIAVWYWTGTASVDLWVADLRQWLRSGKLQLQTAATGMSGKIGGGHFSGDSLYLQHSIGADNGKVSLLDLKKPGYDNWRTIVPEHKNLVIRSSDFARDRIAITYLDKAQTRIALFNADGKPQGDLALPGIGSAALSANDERNDGFLSFSSYNAAPGIYHVELKSGRRELWARPEVPVDSEAIDVRQVWYPSKDGTQISMFLVTCKGMVLDGKNPTILSGYGGFDIPMTPYFSATMFPWFEGGGVYAIPNLRGGGEYGNAWHKAGMLERKQNVFDDFIAAAQWLIDQGYTSAQHLGIAGGSNGGLLTGAAVVQRPDLFGAVISAVPLLDMLRYQNFLMARFWVGEYGSAEVPGQYAYLKQYSPYQQVHRDTPYPAVLLTAGENDTRVHPLHARKMAAALQRATSSDPFLKPVLLWVDRDAGHGAGKPLDLQIRDVADQRIFMMWQLGMLQAPQSRR